MLRIAIALMAFLAVQALGLQAPLPGYGVEEFVWSIDVWGNGTMVNITGPIQNVYYYHLNKLNPPLGKEIASSPPPTSDHHEFKADTIRCIDKMDPVSNPYNWRPAGPLFVHDGAKYLHGVGGQPYAGPGPGNCGRVSCEWETAIWWCNDNLHGITLPDFGTIGDCANLACDLCPDPWSPERCLGQAFDDQGWNCIVRWDNDSC